jgi:hypothetical protein
MFYKSVFTTDNIHVFEGYTKGDKWNGWDTPYFTKDVALKVLEWLKQRLDYHKSEYDSKLDAMITAYESDDVEVWEGMDIVVNGETIHVYPIGAYSWIWETIPNVKVYEYDNHFQGKVILSYIEENGLLNVNVWVFNDIPFYWDVQVDNRTGFIKNHDELLAELKKEKYVNEGYSETI